MQKNIKTRFITTAIAVFLILTIGAIYFLREGSQGRNGKEMVSEQEYPEVQGEDAEPVSGTYFAMSGDRPVTEGIETEELYEQAFACLEDGNEYESFYVQDGILYHDQYAETGKYDEEGLAVYEWRRGQVIAEDVIYVDYNDYGSDGNAVYITKDHVLHGTGYYEGIRLENVKFARVYADAMLALKQDGTLWCRGKLNSLTDGRELSYKDWTFVMEDVAYASLGHYLYFAIRKDGSLYMWGDNSYGVFGDGCLLSPVQVDEENGFKPETCFYTEPVKVADGIRMVWYGIPGEQYCANVSMREPCSARMWFVTEADELFVCGENINNEIRTFYYFGELGSVPEGVQINATGRLYPVISRKGEELTEDELGELNIAYEEFTVPGLEREYRLFFMADSHISLCDARDSEVMEKAAQRRAAFVDENGTDASETFEKLVKASNTLNSDLFIMGGDVLDSAMLASIDYVQEGLTILNSPYLYSMGNHDFEYGLEYFTERAYTDYLPRLDEMRYGADRYMDGYYRYTGSDYQVMEYEDLIILAADDRNNQIGADAAGQLEYLAGLGKPVIVVSHVPFIPLTGSDDLLMDSIEMWKAGSDGRTRVLIGKEGCLPNEDTQKFMDIMLAENSPVELVLSGHIHFAHKDSLNGAVTQIVTGAAYQRHAVCITLKPED